MDPNHFITAYRKISSDKRIQLSHIVFYINLLAYWQEQDYQNPLAVSSKKLMPTARIKSKVTYHKCLKDLKEFGYIEYTPSYDPLRESTITLLYPFELTQSKEVKAQKEMIIRIPFDPESFQIPNAGKAVFVNLRKAKVRAKPK
jgi:hypothetical protein